MTRMCRLWCCAAAVAMVLATPAALGQSRRSQQKPPSKAQLNAALVQAAIAGQEWRAEDLIERGASPNARDAAGVPAVALAFGAGEQAKLGLGPNEAGIQIIKLLLAHGADPNSRGADGASILQLAVRTEKMDLVEAILAKKPTVDLADNGGTTPLMTASTWRKPDAAARLIALGANVNARTKDGATAASICLVCDQLLGIPSEQEDNTVLVFLLDHGADINATNETGANLLMLAAIADRYGAAEELIRRGVNVNVRAKQGFTALMGAAVLKKPRMVKYLLAHGADPSLATDDGSTALLAAVEGGYYTIVDALLKAGANPNAGNKRGETPVIVAQQANKTALVNLLKKAGAKQ